MLSRARIMFRKLRGSGRRSSRGSEPAPSAPATTAVSETVDPPPRAIHISDVRRSPTELPCKRGQQSMSIIVMNAKGTCDYLCLYRLLLKEKGQWEFDPTDNFTTDYFCNGYLYDVCFDSPSGLGSHSAYFDLRQHICLAFTYDASSRESWDEMVAAFERIRSHCKDGVLPFLATMIAAMGEGEGEPPVSRAEAEAFAAERDCLFVKVSPTTGRGICDAVGSLVERAYGARDQYTEKTQRYKRGKAISALFGS